MLKDAIIEELGNLSSVIKEISPLCEHQWIEKIYSICNEFQQLSREEQWRKIIRDDVVKVQKILSLAKKLESALKDEPKLPWWYDNGFFDARWNISKGIKESIELCKVAKSMQDSENNKPLGIKPEHRLYYGLACIYEEFKADKEGRAPDYELMPSLRRGIFETSDEGQKYYLGEFYIIVCEIWKNCLGQPLCSRRESKSTRFIDSQIREMMDSSSFGKRILAGIVAGQKIGLEQ